MADRWAAEVKRSLWGPIGFGCRADITDRFATEDEPGRADIMVVRGGRGAYIEVKSGTDGFDFSNYRQVQRDWANKFALPAPYSMHVWIWLFLGNHPPNYNPDKYQPRKAWLMPVQAFLYAESRLAPYQKTIPYQARKGMRKEVQEQKLDAITLLADWTLTWKGKGLWEIPPCHPFNVTYMQQPPLPILTLGDTGELVTWQPPTIFTTSSTPDSEAQPKAS